MRKPKRRSRAKKPALVVDKTPKPLVVWYPDEPIEKWKPGPMPGKRSDHWLWFESTK
jgi:hypothetical protein